MKKLIFINSTPISSTYGKKINIEWFIKKDIEIEFWNLDRIYFKENNINDYFHNGFNYKYQIPFEIKFYTKTEVETKLKKIDNDIFFCYLDFGNHDDYWLLRLFKKNNIKYYVGPRTIGYFSKRYTIQSRLKKSVFVIKSLFNSLFDYTFFKRMTLLRRFKYTIYKFTDYYKKPIFTVSSGSVGRDMWTSITRAESFLSIPSVDTLWKKSEKIISENYAVFIDDTIFFSPDLALNYGKKNILSKKVLQSYAKNLENVFLMIENELKLKVIIAASGKFNYKDKSFYGNRKIIYGKTNELSQHANMVIGHNSAGLSQAYILCKPIIMIIDDLFSKEKKLKINQVADFYGIKPINIKDFTKKCLINIPINKDYINSHKEKYFLEKHLNEENINEPNQLIFDKLKNL